jgi:phospholipid/cholesterol/gamma-HCH transport system substrate-binding protein
MLSQKTIESLVGLFLLGAFLALSVLAFKVSGLTGFFPGKSYEVTALFDDIGQLKARAPVKIAGVQIGEVAGVTLDQGTFKSLVKLRIDMQYNAIPNDSSASIMTAGLLGDNYIAITPMFSEQFLTNNSQIQSTHPALILEKLLGQLIFRIGGNNDTNKGDKNAK